MWSALLSRFLTLFFLCPPGSSFPNFSSLPSVYPQPRDLFDPFSACCPSFGFPSGLIFLWPLVASRFRSWHCYFLRASLEVVVQSLHCLSCLSLSFCPWYSSWFIQMFCLQHYTEIFSCNRVIKCVPIFKGKTNCLVRPHLP